MSLDALLTLGVLAVMVAALVTSRLSPPVAVLGATATLFLLGVIDASSAFAGFSNPAPITVALLYVVAEGISRTGALSPFVRFALPDTSGRSSRAALGRLVMPAALASAVVANTPIVAMLVPEVTAWADRRGVSASRLLIPLSYATIVGGTLTVIGTSTNLVVSGLLVEAGQEPLSLFELVKISGPLALVTMVAIIALGPGLLPDRVRPRATVAEAKDSGGGVSPGRPFTVSMRVTPGGPLDAVSVGAGGLRHLDSVYLAEVQRGSNVIAPVNPDQTVRGDDVLVFVGQVDEVVDLHRTRGLEPSDGNPLLDLPEMGEHGFFEAVLGPASPLVGRSLAELEFRARYQAAVVGIHRSGAPVEGKLGEVQLRTGDTLLLLAGRDFRSRWRDRGDFLLVSRLGGPDLAATKRAPLALGALGLVAALPLLGLLDVTRATILAVGLLIVGRVLRPREARDVVDVNVVLTIAGAFGLGAALEEVGLARNLGTAIVETLGGFGTAGAVAGIIIATMVLTELVTNAAAAALMFPIALQVGSSVETDPRVLGLVVAVSASSSFLTPVGYQTNTMVYGPGGYRFSDYLRLGLPLALITVVGLTTITMMVS